MYRELSFLSFQIYPFTPCAASCYIQYFDTLKVNFQESHTWWSAVL